MVIHRTRPYSAYGGPESVAGGSRGRRDGLTDPGCVEHYQGAPCRTSVLKSAKKGLELWRAGKPIFLPIFFLNA